MNTVLDDNKTLCLANSERIKLPSTLHMLFEVQDLKVTRRFSLSISVYMCIYLSHSHACTTSLSPSPYLYIYLHLAHKHTISHSHLHTLSNTLSLSPSASFSLSHTHIHSLSLSRTHLGRFSCHCIPMRHGVHGTSARRYELSRTYLGQHDTKRNGKYCSLGCYGNYFVA